MRTHILIAALILSTASAAHAGSSGTTRGLIAPQPSPVESPVVQSSAPAPIVEQPVAPPPVQSINGTHQQQTPQYQSQPQYQPQPQMQQQQQRAAAMRKQQMQQQRMQARRMQQQQMMRKQQMMARNMSIEQKLAYKVHSVKTKIKTTLVRAIFM